MLADQQGQGIIDLFFNLLSQLILPNWPDLIALVPWALIGLIILFALWIAWQWRSAGARNASRVPRPLAGGAPPVGIHMPGPSRWPLVAPIGAALILFSLVLAPKDASGHQLLPVNPLLLVLGLVVTAIAVGGWLRDAMHEWRATAAGMHGQEAMAAADATHLISASTASAVVAAPSAAVVAAPSAAVVAAPSAAVVAEPAVPREPPPGVHMPAPSPWPFFAPIALMVILYGVIFSAALIVAGLLLAGIAAVGWYLDAGREYRTTEEFGHPVYATRDARLIWPRRLVPVFIVVIAIGVLIVLAPVGFTWLNGLTPPSASPTALAVPSTPEISTHTAISFDSKTLVVPANRPFQLLFHNDDPGVPHNVQFATDSSLSQILFDGDVVTGPATATYQVPALQPGTYYFACKIHPNMNGTLIVQPESGGAPAPAPSGGASPGP